MKVHDNNLDDVWGSDNSEDDNQHQYDISKLKTIHNDRGYLDGITSSKETNLQDGFNAGFPNGSNLGYRVGKILGTLQSLSYILNNQETSGKESGFSQSVRQDLVDAQQELKINKVLIKSLFDNNLDLTENSHDILEKWESKIKTYTKYYNIDF
ncbi:hypothetical protein TPHA_0O00250 [Tetrapisispora phaffii CBS 4417]|uniref:Protein YAE1 n=1 Tax=Tetrapisispora phaffii (strain ATCC 24235 / CBS 4417 / NBRC 1672 / NRRL Y-8282 / UCD 70-5) TaxID=1071381 RepID=G8C1G9_TETPH|nr:hypothetical protein TPHA_0O00250 [Tetrapisispora phaffii CBS 4417]CCE65997.1 hypothetical protein TPHA_0O00250 [Tetrapisispora phaffii CBS 4417]